jgi:ABC-type uncharacterized transport system substrate-binding protein
VFQWSCILAIAVLGDASAAERTQWVILIAIIVKAVIDKLDKWEDRRYAREHELKAAMRQETLNVKVDEVKQEVRDNTAVTILQNRPDASMTPDQKRMLETTQAKFLAEADPNALPLAQHDPRQVAPPDHPERSQ